MTQVPPASNDPFAAARAAGEARADAALPPEPAQPGAPAPAAPAPPEDEPEVPVDFFSDNALDGVNFDGLGYRDGKRLEADIVRARDTFRPYHDAFGALDDASRQALLEAGGTLGADLAVVANRLAGLHPQDRAFVQEALDHLSRGNTAQAGQMFAQAAEILGGAPQAGGAPVAPAAGVSTPDLGSPDWAVPPEEQPITRGDLARWQAERDQQAEQERGVATILTQARELGYNPDSEDVVVRADFELLLVTAGQQNGDLSKADEIIKARSQAIIDSFVNEKAADAARPAAPADAGQAPPAATPPLTTMADGNAAMRERVDATLGPDLRRR